MIEAGCFYFQMQYYIIQTQDGKQLDRHLNWVDACDPAQLFRTPHKDIALNQLIELNAGNIRLRARVVPLKTDGSDALSQEPQLASVNA